MSMTAHGSWSSSSTSTQPLSAVSSFSISAVFEDDNSITTPRTLARGANELTRATVRSELRPDLRALTSLSASDLSTRVDESMFLKIPREVRDQIYSYLLPDEALICRCPFARMNAIVAPCSHSLRDSEDLRMTCTQFGQNDLLHDGMIMLVNRQVYREVMEWVDLNVTYRFCSVGCMEMFLAQHVGMSRDAETLPNNAIVAGMRMPSCSCTWGLANHCGANWIQNLKRVVISLPFWRRDILATDVRIMKMLARFGGRGDISVSNVDLTKTIMVHVRIAPHFDNSDASNDDALARPDRPAVALRRGQAQYQAHLALENAPATPHHEQAIIEEAAVPIRRGWRTSVAERMKLMLTPMSTCFVGKARRAKH